MAVELVVTAERTLQSHEFAALYAQAQQFYTLQMQILDAHDTERWADTFTEDAVFEGPSPAVPVPARTGLARYERAGAAARRLAGSPLSHWVGMLDVRPRADGSLHTRCSAVAHATPTGGGSRVLYVCVMEDVLVRSRGEWRIAYRRVIRDDLA
ncbi:nuclear transport factor 2 family protein [Streptomyces sp. NPDC057686]|uniref:nuclear transport factor 2 family protein n=1 Tax=Streptomyces sp. NPDC057686 TaxID=3346212 RepID=UPI0036916DA2